MNKNYLTKYIYEVNIITLICVLLMFSNCSGAQSLNIPPVIAPYKILQPDSTYTSYTALKKGKPVMLIYFAPDCGHCQKLMKDLKPKMTELKNIQIVMISFTRTEYPYLSLLRNFKRDYSLAKYPNVIIGTEYPTFKVGLYYQLKHTPFVAIYGKDGRLVQAFENQPEASDLLMAIKKT